FDDGNPELGNTLVVEEPDVAPGFPHVARSRVVSLSGHYRQGSGAVELVGGVEFLPEGAVVVRPAVNGFVCQTGEDDVLVVAGSWNLSFHPVLEVVLLED